MKFHLAKGEGPQLSQVGADFVEVDGVRHAQSFWISQNGTQAWTPWDFAPIVAAQPSVVLIGTGARLSFARPALLRALIDAQIGYEMMDNAAAARTFNVLQSEGRVVVACFLFPEIAVPNADPS